MAGSREAAASAVEKREKRPGRERNQEETNQSWLKCKVTASSLRLRVPTSGLWMTPLWQSRSYSWLKRLMCARESPSGPPVDPQKPLIYSPIQQHVQQIPDDTRMDPVTGIGLAAAILQFIEFAAKVVDRLADFGAAFENGPKLFRQIRTELPLILDILRRIQDRSKAGDLDTTTEIALCQVIQDCQRSAKQLNDLLDRTIPTPNASSWERKKKALISLTKDKTVKEIADSLHKYVGVLTFHQVVDKGTSLDASSANDPPVFWVVPFDRNTAFVGRESIIQQIYTAFSVKEGSRPKAALCGLGGIG